MLTKLCMLTPDDSKALWCDLSSAAWSKSVGILSTSARVLTTVVSPYFSSCAAPATFEALWS